MHPGKNRRLNAALIEALEPRQFLSAAPTFVLYDSSPTLIAVLSNRNVTIAQDAASHGPSLQASINWGDGTTSPATLQRAANGRIQVWAAHAYSAVRTYPVHVLTATNSGTPVVAVRTSANVLLNAQRGRTIKCVAGQEFSGVVSTVAPPGGLPMITVPQFGKGLERPVARTGGLLVITVPQNSLTLPAGARFAQYTVGDAGAVATLRIDWGDGIVSDGSFVSNAGGNYNVLGAHTYAATGSYRTIVNVILQSTDGTLLHVDMINGTAHVTAGPRQHPPFDLPSHAQLNWSDILPQGTTIITEGDNTGSTGSPGTSGSSVSSTISSGASAGVLRLNSGTSGSLVNLSGSMTLGGGIFNATSGTTLVLTRINAGSGVIAQFTGTGSTFSAFMTSALADPLLSQRLSNSSRINADGSVSARTLIIANATTSLVTYLALDPAAGAEFLAVLHSGNLVFNPATPTDLVISLLQKLPADFSGDILIPPTAGDATLPELPGATIIRGTQLAPGTSVGIYLPSIQPGTSIIGSGTLTLNPSSPSTTPISIITTPVLFPGGTGTLTLNNTSVSLTLSSNLSSANWTVHASNTVSCSSPLVLSAPLAAILPMVHGGTLTFDADVTGDQIVSAFEKLPADYAGTITLTMAADGLVLRTLPAATIIVPVADPGTG